MKILIVDDDKFILAVARDIIAANVPNDGVLVCSTPENVPEILKEQNIGVVLLDIIMPGYNGIDLLKFIRGRDEFKDVQIIMFTGIKDEDSMQQCFDSGANDFINKPINPTELIARTRAAIKMRQYILQLKEMLHKIDEQYNELQLMTQKLQQAQFSLFQTEKLASLGEIAAGVAHEINNPLGFVNSNLETLERYLIKIRDIITQYREMGSQVSDYSISRTALIHSWQMVSELEQHQKLTLILNDIGPLLVETQEGIGRVAKIVQSLRNFAWTGREDETTVNDMSQIVEEALLIMQNEIKYIAYVKKEFHETSKIECDKGQIAQVFVNILNNASQAIKSLERDRMGLIEIQTLEQDGFVVCRISDDGPGIRAENLSRIFDPFFTTKPVGSGTGLGLSIAYGLIKKHGGDLQVESEWGKGATFIVKLPIQEKSHSIKE